MNRNQSVQLGFVVACVAAMLFSFNNCGGFESTQMANQSSNGVNPNPNPSPLPSKKLSISVPNQHEQNLGEDKNFSVTVSSTNSFSGNVVMSIDRSSLDAINGGSGVAITISPEQFILSSGSSQIIQVNVKTYAASPSFSSAMVQVAASPEDSSDKAEGQIGLKVNAVYELKMPGGASVAERWLRADSLSFRSHIGGLKLRFINYDQASTHIVHGSRAIPHQNVAQPLAAAESAEQPGGVYEVNIAESETRDAIYWYHDIETSANSRTMSFGVSDPRVSLKSVINSLVRDTASVDGNSAPKNAQGFTCHDSVGVD